MAFGNANFTKAAMAGPNARPGTSNAENFNLFDGFPSLNQHYAGEFERLLAEAQR